MLRTCVAALLGTLARETDTHVLASWFSRLVTVVEQVSVLNPKSLIHRVRIGNGYLTGLGWGLNKKVHST